MKRVLLLGLVILLVGVMIGGVSADYTMLKCHVPSNCCYEVGTNSEGVLLPTEWTNEEWRSWFNYTECFNEYQLNKTNERIDHLDDWKSFFVEIYLEDKDDQESRISTLESWKQTIDDIFNAMRQWTGFAAFWNWFDSPRECQPEETKCEADDRYVCSDYEWTFDQTCEYGCNETIGECNQPPKVNCNTDDTQYCDNSNKVVEDYYCEWGFGTDDNCDEGHCLLNQQITSCEFGCENGECNSPPYDNCLTKQSDYECKTFRWGSYSIEKDYYACQWGHGTSTECEPGFCRFRNRWNYCRNGCNEETGLCN